MHLCVSEARQLTAPGQDAYLGYNVHVNGAFHCTVRYKQLHNLHTQLQKRYPHSKLPDFPPKKLLPLTNSQVEERRQSLERYLQLIGQNSTLSNSDLLIGFLASAQQEMHDETEQNVTLDVYTMLGCKTALSVKSTDRTDAVLEKTCLQMFVPRELIKYFCLYLADVDAATDELTIFKRLEDFESPYISQKVFKTEHKIYIRRSYWDLSYDLMVMNDKAALGILYAQTVAEMNAGWITASSDVRDCLNRLKAGDRQKEYLDCIRNERHYGCILAGRGVADWSMGGVKKGHARILLCHSGLLLISADRQETFFKVVRMRCWRITTLRQSDSINDVQNSFSQNESGHVNGDEPKLELSFEYLVNKDSLQWVTILSDRSMFMSVCLQSIIDELMNLKPYCRHYIDGNDKNDNSHRKQSLTYMKRDGSSQLITPSSSNDAISSTIGEVKPLVSTREKFSIKRLAEKFSSVSFRSGHDFIENNAFGEIGDDDL